MTIAQLVEQARKRDKDPSGTPILGKDSRGEDITGLLALNSGSYAIYRARDQMMVHFADDPAVADRQRSAIGGLGGLRAKLRYLIDGLDNEPDYEFQLSNALQLALDGSVDEAKKVLEETVANAEKERQCAGRIQYLAWGGMLGLLLVTLLVLAHWAIGWPASDQKMNANVPLLAALGGTFGALFSIGLAVRTRAVAIDHHWSANISDGVLRIAIGALGAAALAMLLWTGILPKITIGDLAITGNTAGWGAVVVIGFIAGFLERLVPDLLQPPAKPSVAG